MQLIAFILDCALVGAAVAAYLARPRIGGELARGMRVLLIGVMVLGLAHLVETVLFVALSLDRQVNEIVHRLLVGAGFVFVIQGFMTMRQAFEEITWTPTWKAPYHLMRRIRTWLMVRFSL